MFKKKEVPQVQKTPSKLDWNNENALFNYISFFNDYIDNLINTLHDDKINVAENGAFIKKIEHLLCVYVAANATASPKPDSIKPQVLKEIKTIDFIIDHLKANKQGIAMRLTKEFEEFRAFKAIQQNQEEELAPFVEEMKLASKNYVQELVRGFKGETHSDLKARDKQYTDQKEKIQAKYFAKIKPISPKAPPVKIIVSETPSLSNFNTPKKPKSTAKRRKKTPPRFVNNGASPDNMNPSVITSPQSKQEDDSYIDLDYINLLIETTLLGLELTNEEVIGDPKELVKKYPEGTRAELIRTKIYISSGNIERNELLEINKMVMAMALEIRDNSIPKLNDDEVPDASVNATGGTKKAEVLALVNGALIESGFPIDDYADFGPDDFAPYGDKVQVLLGLRNELSVDGVIADDILEQMKTTIKEMGIFAEVNTTPTNTPPVITPPVITPPVITTPVITTPVITTPVITTPVITTQANTTPANTTPANTTTLQKAYAEEIIKLEKVVNLEERYKGYSALLLRYMKEAKLTTALKDQVLAVSNAVRTMNDPVTKNKVLKNTLELLLDGSKKSADEYKNLGKDIVDAQPKSTAAKVLCAAMMALGALVLALGVLICVGTVVGAPVLGVATLVGGAFLLSTGGFGFFGTNSTSNKNKEFATGLNTKIDALAESIAPRG